MDNPSERELLVRFCFQTFNIWDNNHVRGQGQKLGGPHARRAAAKRSYPTSEVRGSGREYQTATGHRNSGEELSRIQGQGGRPRGVTPRPRSGAGMRGVTPHLRSGAAAGRRYPTPQARGQGRWPGGPTLCPRSRGCAGAGGPRGAIPH